MEVRFGINQQAVAGEAGKSAKPVGSGIGPDTNRQKLNSCCLQLGKGWHQCLGVFEAVEISKLGKQHHQPAPA